MLNALCAGEIGAYMLDIVVAAIMVVFVIICAKKGFVNCIIGFVSTILCLFLAISLAKVTVSITGGLFGLQGSLEETFIKSFSSFKGFDIDISGQNVDELLATQDLSAVIATLVVKNYAGVTLPAGTTLAILVGETVAELMSTLIAGVALFLIFRVVMFIIRKVVNAITKKLKLVNALNRILGALVGLLEATLIISLVISVLALIPSAGMQHFFNSSIILTFLYNHNPLVAMLGWFI